MLVSPLRQRLTMLDIVRARQKFKYVLLRRLPYSATYVKGIRNYTTRGREQ